MRLWLSLALAISVAACSTAAPPERLVFGVLGDRAAGTATPEADTQMRAFLDAKLGQICTTGYDTVKVDTLAAEGGNEIVDEEVRCKAYRLLGLF